MTDAEIDRVIKDAREANKAIHQGHKRKYRQKIKCPEANQYQRKHLRHRRQPEPLTSKTH